MSARHGWLAVAALLTLAACAPTDSSANPPTGAGAWRELPESPLSPRDAGLAVWTGREVLIVGGTDQPCPPNADCALDETPLSDGAALDPATGQWRRIAAAPVPLPRGQAVVVGQTVYVLSGESQDELLTYSVDDDSWDTLPVPYRTAGWYALAAAGDRVVAYLTSAEAEPGDDYLYDPASGEWTALPADPLGDAFDRSMVWAGGELLLFDHRLVPNPGAEAPSLTRAAAYDPASGAWRRLPHSEILTTQPWLVTDDGELVNPNAGSADGGEIGNWGRSYPEGGRLDPATGTWSPLPDPPAWAAFAAGAFTETAAVYVGVSGAVLDLSTDAWLRLPSPPGEEVVGRAVVTAGRDLVAFGGTDWASAGGTLLNTAWIWTPPH